MDIIYTRERIRELMKSACIHGMIDEVLTFPISLEPVSVSEDSIRKRFPGMPEQIRDSSNAAKPMTVFDHPNLKLETLFSNGMILKDEDNDGLPDRQNFHIVFPEDADEYAVQALCDLTARIAASCTGMNSDLLADSDADGNLIIFENIEEPSVRWEDCDGRVIIHVYGTGIALSCFMSQFCTQFDSDRYSPMEEKTWQINQALMGRTWDGQKCFIRSHPDDSEYFADCTEKQISEFSGYRIHSLQIPQRIWQDHHEMVSETEVLLDRIYETEIDEDQPCLIQAAVSKSYAVRSALKASLLQKYPNAQIELISAYKPGFSWIEELCIPEMKKLKVDSVRILFKPYLKPGQTEWKDEDGAVPKKANASMEQQGWMELPIRFLQELYPIDDAVAEELKISRDNIVFESSDDLAWTYQIKAFSDNKQIYENHYQVRTYERAYLDSYPEAGLVHPDLSYAVIIQNHKVLLDQTFPTDRDQIWTLFQTETLPHLRTTIMQNHPQGIGPEDQPLFSRLKFSIQISETDRSLHCRQDRISPVDALQEDLYFTALEYFKHLGRELCGTPLDSPGLIEPDIRIAEGNPIYSVTLEQPVRRKACMESKTGTQDMNILTAECVLTEVSMKERQLVCHYRAEGMTDEYQKHFLQYLKQGTLDLSEVLSDIPQICFNDGPAESLMKPEPVDAVNVDDIDLHESEIIGYDCLETIMQDLKRVTGLRIISLAQSVQHRTVFGAVFTHPEKGLVTKARALRDKPSVILDCRHHANEVSSTNSSLTLIRKILTDPEYQSISERMNLVIVPMENPDGAAVHERLAKINPYNKLHVARYNALGREFAYESMKLDTIHTEAHAMFRLYREMLPDVFIDDHGVPSHEWEQPYSGYTSPIFKGFWLPRSILYGYFWIPLDEEYESNQLLCHSIADAVADAVSKDDELMRENQEWQNRFEKYAHAWMPKLFPADYYRGMINYWIGRNQSDQQLYYSHRFPWITTVYYTSEVADETAQNDYLQLCAKTHVLENIAVLKLIERLYMAYNTDYVESPRGIRIRMQRRRPMHL